MLPTRPICHGLAPLFFMLILLGCGGPNPDVTETLPAETEPAPEEALPPPGKDGPFLVEQTIAATYAPGAENPVSITLDYQGSDPVTALALQLTLPLGWQFGTIAAGPKPAVVPKEGATDTVTMVWIQSPAFPAEIEYTVTVPDWVDGTQVLEAVAIYRALEGELRSPVNRVETKYLP